MTIPEMTKRLRDMAAQILTQGSSGKHFFNEVADSLETMANTERCCNCGSDKIYHGPPDCPSCGAPNCCQTCCRITKLEIKLQQTEKEYQAASAQNERYLQTCIQLRADKEKAEKACAERLAALQMVEGEMPLATWRAIEKASLGSCGQGYVSREELRPTIELEKYLIGVLASTASHHPEGTKCICWRCAAHSDLQRDYARLQKLMEDKNETP